MATAAAALLATQLAACGNSDEVEAPPSSISPPAAVKYQRATSVAAQHDADGSDPAATDGEQIREVLESVQIGLATGDGRAVCRALTPTGRYELARLRRGGPGACVRVIHEIGQRRRRDGDATDISKVVSVERHGNRASAKVRNTRAKPFVGREFGLSFAKIDGTWRLGSLVLLDTDAIDNLPGGHNPRFYEPPHYTIPEVLYDVQTDYLRYRGNSVCNDLTQAGQREIEKSGIGGRSETCEEIVPELLARSLAQGLQTWSTKVLSVRRSGNRAMMVVKNDGAKPYRVPVIREEGRWLLPTLTLAEPVAELLRGR